MHITIETITPKQAEAMLELNTNNRPLGGSRVRAIKRAIENGEWRMNGDAIRISSSNVLLDGQTRLSAIVAAGIPVDSVVIRGLPDDVFATIDINGSKRTASDVLAMKGIKNYTACAAIANAILSFEKTKSSRSAGKDISPTVTEVQERASSDLGIQEAARFAMSNKILLKMMSAKICGYVRYHTQKDDQYQSDIFFNGLITGAGLESGSPVLLLRDTLLRDAASIRRVSPYVRVSWCFYAYKALKEGRTIKQLKVFTDGKSRNAHLYQGLL